MPFSLRILGKTELRGPDGSEVALPLGKTFAVVIYLCCANRPVSREEIGTLLWPSATGARRRHSVRQALWLVRNALGEDLFEGEEALTLKDGVLQSDHFLFLEALREGEVPEAMALWGGGVLSGLSLSGVRSWDRWVDEFRTDIENRFRRVLVQYAEKQREIGDLPQALFAYEKSLEVAPLSVEVHRGRVEVLLELRRLDEAREALNDALRLLGEDNFPWDVFSPLEGALEHLAEALKTRRDSLSEGLLEFVGRSTELAALRGMWNDVRRGEYRIALVTGPPGVGKTRLANEFLAGLVGDEVQVVKLKGYETEAKFDRAGFADLTRKLLGLPGSAGISAASNALLQRLLPSLNRGTPSDGASESDGPVARVDALVDLLEAVSFESSVVIMVDDAQWMDEPSQELLLGAMRRIRKGSIFFLLLGRTDPEHRGWRQLRRSLVSGWPGADIPLAPLTRGELRELLSLHITWPTPEVADQAVRWLNSLTGGNPLFIAELLRDLVDRGMLGKELGNWTFQRPIFPDDLPPPGDLQALVAERLKRLSSSAGTLAAVLARHGKQVSINHLARMVRIPDFQFDDALSELVERDIIAWGEGTSVDFSHDLLRDAVGSRSAQIAGDERAVTNRAWRKHEGWWLGGMALVALLVIGWLGLSERLLGGTARPELYGGGMIIAEGPGEEQLRVRVSGSAPGEWAESAFLLPSSAGYHTVFRGRDGAELWYRAEDNPDGPDIVRLGTQGEVFEVAGGPGDQFLHDVSPAGTQILFTSSTGGTESFAHVLWVADWDGSRAKSLFPAGGSIAVARWAPDGDRIAVVLKGASDTLNLLNLRGELLGSLPLGEVQGFDWCHQSLVTAISSPEGVSLLTVSPETLEVDTIAPLDIGSLVECSPDGKAVLLRVVEEGRVAYAVRDLETGEVHSLGLEILDSSSLHWVPDRPTRTVEQVRVDPGTVRIRWGDNREVAASVRYSDGTEDSEGLEWTPVDPRVATVDERNSIVGNRPGHTAIYANRGYSFSDTVLVVVEEGDPPGVLFSDRFESLDTTRWMSIGDPRPEVALQDDGPMLRLTGDDKYSDGILSLIPIPLDRGVTVDLEFRLDLTRALYQHFQVCLADGDPNEADQTVGTFAPSGQMVCFLYPSRESDRLDPAEASFFVPYGVERRIKRVGELPPTEWTHVALQVQADGLASLILNRDVVSSNPIRIQNHADSNWVLLLEADAVDTEVAVRNLVVWAEPRY